MSAIAPPPVGAEAEPTVVSDNACALAALRASLRSSHVALSAPGSRYRRPPPSLAVILALGAARAIVAIGGRGNVRTRNELRRRPARS